MIGGDSSSPPGRASETADERDAPATSYTIWFSQRVGSTWLCDLLAATGVAGRPGEWLEADAPETLLERHGASDPESLVTRVRELGSAPDGTFGIKHGYAGSAFDRLAAWLGIVEPVRLDGWERLFPNHRHVFLTRRNKVRLAVSWWRAIRSGEWHRRRGEGDPNGEPPLPGVPSDAYSFDAIDRLVAEAVLREAGIQSLFDEAGTVPLTVTYDDLVADPAREVGRVLRHLGRPPANAASTAPCATSHLVPTADEVSEAWVRRYREEKQSDRDRRAW